MTDDTTSDEGRGMIYVINLQDRQHWGGGGGGLDGGSPISMLNFKILKF